MAVNARKAAIDHLNGSGFSAYAQRPKDAPSTFVTVDITGGSATERVAVRTLTFDCWAPSEAAADTLSLAVWDSLKDMELRAGVAKVERQSVQNLSRVMDGTQGMARVVASVVVPDN